MNTISSSSFVDEGKKFLKKYNPHSMNFLLWLNNFEYIIDLVDVPDDEKVNFFFHMINVSAIEMIQSEGLNKNSLQKLPYNLFISIMVEMYSDFQEEQALTYRFYARNQIEGESVRRYANALTKLASKCKFSDDRDANLLYRFIFGLKSFAATNMLAKIQNLTFKQAVDIAEIIDSL
ncbi:hypothetical protein M0802_014104 [Mischocyttarus mexicanus]|nr:hypothetical protein M0802_014104 [Mischocyttarus mexicanus]